MIASITMLAWVFAYVWTLTDGGPGTATTVLELYIYNPGLRNSLPGMASAVAVMLLAGHAAARGPPCSCVRARTAGGVRVSGAVETQHVVAGSAARLAPQARRRWPAVARHVFLLAAALLALYPVLFMVMTALKTQDSTRDPTRLPWPITFENFGDGAARRRVPHLVQEQRDPHGRLVRDRHGLRPRWPRSPSRRCACAAANVLLCLNIALMIVPPVVMLIPLFMLFASLHS